MAVLRIHEIETRKSRTHHVYNTTPAGRCWFPRLSGGLGATCSTQGTLRTWTTSFVTSLLHRRSIDPQEMIMARRRVRSRFFYLLSFGSSLESVCSCSIVSFAFFFFPFPALTRWFGGSEKWQKAP